MKSKYLVGGIIFWLMSVFPLTAQNVDFPKIWQTLGPPGFSESRVDMTAFSMAEGTPMIVFREIYPSKEKVTAMKLDGNQWKEMAELSFPRPKFGNAILAIAINLATPYVVLADEKHGYKATLLKWVPSGWINVGAAGFSSWPVKSCSLNVDQGTPYVILSGPVGESEESPMNIMEYDGTKWVVMGSYLNGVGHRMFLDQGIPYLIFNKPWEHKDGFVKWNGSDWEPAFPDIEDKGEALFLVNNGIPYAATWDVVPSDKANANLHHAHHVEKNHDGTQTDQYFRDEITLLRLETGKWKTLGQPGFIRGEKGSISLSFDTGILYASFMNGLEPMVLKYDHNVWMDAGVQHHEETKKTGIMKQPFFSAKYADRYSHTTPQVWIYQDTPYWVFSDKDYDGKATVKIYQTTHR